MSSRTLHKPRLLALLKELGPIKLAPRAQPGWTDKRADANLKPPRRKHRR